MYSGTHYATVLLNLIIIFDETYFKSFQSDVPLYDDVGPFNATALFKLIRSNESIHT